MTTGLETAIVRIRKSNGIVVGAGFLVSQKHIITCAHVIADALGISRDTHKRPTEVVHLDFPLIAPEERLTGRVVFWRPVPLKGSTSVKGKEDIAALELNSTLPETAQAVDLVIEEDLRGHSFRTFGFPAGHDDGLEATGVLRGRQGTGWIQIEDVKETGVRLEAGFSGAPIWGEQLNGVVGMAVAADQKRPEAKIAFMIPTKVIATAWTALAERTIPPLILTKEKRFRFWPNNLWLLVGLLLVFSVSTILLIKKQVGEFMSRGEQICFSKAQKQKKLIIAVAKFSNLSDGNLSNHLYTKERILDRLRRQKLYNFVICPTSESVLDTNGANQLGKKLKAEVVIWGRWDMSGFELRLEGINQDIIYLNSLSASSAEVSQSDLQTKDWPELVNVMTAFALSEIYGSQGKISEARDILKEALDEVNLSRLNQNNKRNAKVLANAYFFLGLLFNKTASKNCENTQEDCRNALLAYKRSSSLDGEMSEAFLSQGILYWKLRDRVQAITAFTQLIESGSDLSSVEEARVYRAKVYLEQGNTQAAIRDLKLVCQLPPDEPNNCHFLGLAQLQAGQTEEARKTYQDVSPYLNQETKAMIVNDLRSFTKKSAKVELVIKTIIASLE